MLATTNIWPRTNMCMYLYLVSQQQRTVWRNTTSYVSPISSFVRGSWNKRSDLAFSTFVILPARNCPFLCPINLSQSVLSFAFKCQLSMKLSWGNLKLLLVPRHKGSLGKITCFLQIPPVVLNHGNHHCEPPGSLMALLAWPWRF